MCPGDIATRCVHPSQRRLVGAEQRLRGVAGRGVKGGELGWVGGVGRNSKDSVVGLKTGAEGNVAKCRLAARSKGRVNAGGEDVDTSRKWAA